MATFLGVIAIFMWGGLAILGSYTVDIPPFQLLFLCFSLSTILMFIKRIKTRQALLTKPCLSLSQWLIGIVGLFGFHFCYFIALKNAPAIEVSMISYLWPVLFVLFISSKENFLFSLIGSLVGFIGIGFVIAGNEAISLSQEYIIGYSLAACCAFIWSFYSWFQSKAKNSVDDIGWLSMAVALLSLFVHTQFETSHWNFTAQQWLGILLLGIGPVGGAFYLWDIGLKKGNRKLLASLSYCAPLISAVILSLAGLNTWSINILISLFFILLGALISSGNLLPGRRKN